MVIDRNGNDRRGYANESKQILRSRSNIGQQTRRLKNNKIKIHIERINIKIMVS